MNLPNHLPFTTRIATYPIVLVRVLKRVRDLMRVRAFLLFCALLSALISAPAPVLALDVPKPSPADPRVRYAAYNSADVIELDAVIGVATHIVLEEGEGYSYHVFGDSAAYAFTYKDNHLFFKPVAQQANTNLIVVTNRRSYAFKLTYSDTPNAQALYKLVIRYPDSVAKRAHSDRTQNAIQNAFAKTSAPVNWQGYTQSGDLSLAPVHAWDDGRQTWLQFAQQADMPTVYRVTPDGQEVITNYHMADDRTMVLHRTATRWHLRLGNQVLSIHNEDYGRTELPAHTGTVSPDVIRVLRGTNLPSANAHKVAP